MSLDSLCFAGGFSPGRGYRCGHKMLLEFMLKEVPEIFTFPNPVEFSNVMSALVRETYQTQNVPKISTYSSFSSVLSLIRKLSNTDLHLFFHLLHPELWAKDSL